MSPKSEITTIWKPLGLSMGELVEKFRNEEGVDADTSITYAGRLDPMAEGTAILLVGDAVHKKNEFLELPKEYEFECLWGMETDTYDVLGLVKNPPVSPGEIFTGGLERVAKSFIGRRMQPYPPYSSKPVLGKPLFVWAREGKLSQIKIPEKEVEIYSLDILSEQTFSGQEVLRSIEDKISQVHGDFRQQDIVARWNEMLLSEKDMQFFITTMRAQVSSGAYIRSLVHEIGAELGVGGTTFHIIRTKVGDYFATEK